MKIPTPEAFITLGCEPFWSLSREDEAKLKTHVMALSRKYHPDLISLDASDEEREIIEAKSSAINAAYLKLKEESKRCDYILNEVEKADPENFSLKNKVELPVELSMMYFELQDSISEGEISEAVKQEIEDFIQKLKALVQEENTKLHKTLTRLESKFKISESPTPEWGIQPDDYQNVASSRGLQKYLDRILIDIRKYQ